MSSLSGERMPTKGSDRWKPIDTARLCEHFVRGDADPTEQSTRYIVAPRMDNKEEGVPKLPPSHCHLAF